MEEEQSARHDFPIMLYDLLEDTSSDPAKTEIVSWMPHGRAFRVHKPEDFEVKIMPDYFQERYGSFRHLLQQWGFLRLSRGRDRGAYYNVHFLRGHRSKIVGVDKIFMEKDMPKYLSPRDEPNLYLEPDVSTIGKKKRGRPSKKDQTASASSSPSSDPAVLSSSITKDNQDISTNIDSKGTAIEETGKRGTVAVSADPSPPITSPTSRKRKSSVPRKILTDANITEKKPISVAVMPAAMNPIASTTNDDASSSTSSAAGDKRKATAPSKVNTDEKEILASPNSGSGNKRKATLPTKVDTDEKEILASPNTTSGNKRKATKMPASKKKETDEKESSSAKTTRNKKKKKVMSSASSSSDDQQDEDDAVGSEDEKQQNEQQKESKRPIEARPEEEQEKSARHDFPIMLYDMLENISYDEAKSKLCSWQPHGKAFKVHKPDDFETNIMPDYFTERYASFRFLLERWGFVRLSRGRDRGAYYNIHFINGQRKQLIGISKEKMKKDMPQNLSPREEPNFYIEYEKMEKEKKANKKKQPPPSNKSQKANKKNDGSNISKKRKEVPKTSDDDSDDNSKQPRPPSLSSPDAMDIEDLHNDEKDDDDDDHRYGISDIPRHNLMIPGDSSETTAAKKTVKSIDPASGKKKGGAKIDINTPVFFTHENDVLFFGRGGRNNKHAGNDNLREIARAKYCHTYQKASKKEKPVITLDLVREIRSLNPPGRFLRQITKESSTSSSTAPAQWEDVGDEIAREKVSGVLRDECENMGLKLGYQYNRKGGGGGADNDDDNDGYPMAVDYGENGVKKRRSKKITETRTAKKQEKKTAGGGGVGGEPQKKKSKEQKEKELIKQLMTAPLCQCYLPPIY